MLLYGSFFIAYLGENVVGTRSVFMFGCSDAAATQPLFFSFSLVVCCIL